MTNDNDDIRGLLLCTFRLGDQLFGVDVRDVQEVLRNAELTPVPNSDSAIAGQINLRGQIATTLDLRTLLHLDPAEADVDGAEAESMHVVVRWGSESVSLLVDRIGEVLEVDHATFEQPPVIRDPEVAAMIIGVYKLEQELLLVLDVARMVAMTSNQGEEAA